MSHDCTEALSPYTREGPGGPTPTTTTQDQFAQRLRGVLRRLNARMREAIIKRDLFNLREQNGREALVDDIPDEVFETESRRAAALGFLRWVRQQLDENFLTVVSEDTNQFIRKAYARGLENVADQLNDADLTLAPTDTDNLLGRPFHQQELQTLFTRTYENLVSVRDDVAQAVRDELVEGFTQGENPTKIARSLTDRVDSIGKHRATMIARSEVMNAYSQGTLSRMEEINSERERTDDGQLIAGHGTWDAAMAQPNTCPFCRAVNGTMLTADEMATTTVQFRGDVYRLAPPSHPQGRCRIRVEVGPDRIDEPLEDRLPAEVTVLT